jgi:hypothetical protein
MAFDQKKVRVTFKDGKTHIEALGYKGGTCVKAVERLKEAMSARDRGAQALTPEYFAQPEVEQVKELE